MKNNLQKIMTVLVLCCVLCTGCSKGSILYQSTDTAMGTIISQTLYVSTDTETARKISGEIISGINALEQSCLSWRLDSAEIYKINSSAGSGTPVRLSENVQDYLRECKNIYDASAGAFDITIGSVARLWNIDTWAAQGISNWGTENGMYFTLPTEDALNVALAQSGMERCRLEGDAIIIPAGMQLDMGAVGKGIALDCVEQILSKQKVDGAVISVGGSILTYGQKPDGSRWNVGIVNPMDTSRNVGILSVPGGCCISTSGDYERYVEVDGVRYHHILDPDTGKPADSGVRSVTILYVGESGSETTKDGEVIAKGLRSDALSTACFVLGVQQGLTLAEDFGAEALFVDDLGEIHMTEGMKQYFCLSNLGK